MSKFYHPYHLVSESPWPILGSLCMIVLMLGAINWFNYYMMYFLVGGYFLLVLILFQWWRDIIRESTFQGCHTLKVLKSLKMGMVLFILSEVMFFLSFFWTYFHMFLSPSVEIGSVWPPLTLLVFNPLNIPLLNTLILLSSGVWITLCHYLILKSNYKGSKISLAVTMFLGFLFMFFQYMEYSESYFTISDSIYGSIFYMITGFHGLHVFIGTLFIYVTYMRLFYKQYSENHHLGFEFTSWYWHFVDVVWLFLYILVYWLSY